MRLEPKDHIVRKLKDRFSSFDCYNASFLYSLKQNAAFLLRSTTTLGDRSDWKPRDSFFFHLAHANIAGSYNAD